MAKLTIEAEDTVDAATLRLLLDGMSRSQMHRLEQAGRLVRSGRDYRLLASLTGYAASLREAAERAKSHAEDRRRLLAARARQIELRTAVQLGTLCRQEESLELFIEVLAPIKADLVGLAASVTRDREVRRAIDERVTVILNDAADRAERAFGKAA
jgi:hypothetical protein